MEGFSTRAASLALAATLVTGCGSLDAPTSRVLDVTPPAASPSMAGTSASPGTPTVAATLSATPAPQRTSTPRITPRPTATAAALDAWEEVQLTATGDSYARDFLTLGTSTVVAAYTRHPGGGVFTRRSSDSGATWEPPIQVSATGADPSIDGLGNDVDVVWREEDKVLYAHSSDGGGSFGPELTLVSPAGGNTNGPSVARGEGGLVVVAWAHDTNAVDEDPPTRALVKISTDGGASFGGTKLIARGSILLQPFVVAGDGVLYLAYVAGFAEDEVAQTDEPRKAYVMRSLDDGATWSRPMDFGRVDQFDLSITAADSEAYVAVALSGFVNYYRTDDRGANWSPHFLSEDHEPGGLPVVASDGGSVYAVYRSCVDAAIIDGECSPKLVFRMSNDGLKWTPAEIVWTAPEDQAQPGVWPYGVGFAGNPLVFYQAWTQPLTGNFDIDVYVGTRTR